MAGFGRPLRAKRWKYRTSHYLRPLRSAGCIFRLDAWKSHDACGPPQVFLQGAIEHRLVTSLIQLQAEQKQLARAIELRFRSGPIWKGCCKALNQSSPLRGRDYLLGQISPVFIGRIDSVFERSIPLTGFNICLAVFFFRTNYFMSILWVEYNHAHGRASMDSR